MTTVLADRFIDAGRFVIVTDVDDVAMMVCAPAAGAAGLWFAAHQAHGALVGQWMRSDADVVVSVGPTYTQAEHEALFGQLPSQVRLLRVLIDAPLSATRERVRADHRRGASRERDFHEPAHAHYRALMSEIPADLTFDSGDITAARIAMSIYEATQLTD
ncbi:MAG TPA: hypothetical protein VJ301_11380 [Propionibacteriaceae bacterium]|nr:hypothetical protein [Propionibacteriaceae bacterium]